MENNIKSKIYEDVNLMIQDSLKKSMTELIDKNLDIIIEDITKNVIDKINLEISINSEEELKKNLNILTSILKNISKARRFIKNRNIENPYDFHYLEYRKLILLKLGLSLDTNHKIYLKKLPLTKNISNEECKQFIFNGRIIEHRFINIIKLPIVSKSISNDIDLTDTNIIGIVYDGYRCDEDFYVKLIGKYDYLKHGKIKELRDNHSIYCANIPYDEETDEISFCHA